MHTQFLLSLSNGLAVYPSLVLNAGGPTLLASLPFLLITNFSVTIPQTLARAPQCLALSTSRDAFPGRSHVVPALLES